MESFLLSLGLAALLLSGAAAQKPACVPLRLLEPNTENPNIPQLPRRFAHRARSQQRYVLASWIPVHLLIRLVGKCLTAASNNDGAVVTIQGCTGADAQKWTFDGGSVKVFGNKCLDVTDGSTADGVKLQIWTCNVPNANQQFFYTVKHTRRLRGLAGHLQYDPERLPSRLDRPRQMHGSHRRQPKRWESGESLVAIICPLTVVCQIQLWACSGTNPNQVWNTGYMANALPQTSESGQSGTNNCGTGSSQTSQCQTAWIK